MKKSSYVLALLIIAASLIFVFSFSAVALDESNIYTYGVYSNAVHISGLTDYGKTLTSLTIPDTIDSLPVTKISNIKSNVLESVIVPGSVKELLSNAFSQCPELVNVTLNVGLEKLGSGCFKECQKLQSIYIPVGVKSIGNAAFSNCKKLSDISLPDTIEYIGNQVFGNTAKYNSFMNSTAKALYVGNHLIKVKTRSHENYGVEEGTITIAKNAYSECPMLKTLYLPNSIKNICEFAFYGCTALENVVIYSDCANIHSYAFDETAIADDPLNYENGLLYIGNYLYDANEDIVTANIKEGTAGICARAFSGCSSLKSVVIPDSVKVVGEYAFSYASSIEEIYFGSGLQYIDYQTFSTALKRIHIKSIRDWLEIEYHSFNARPNSSRYIALYIDGEQVTSVDFPEDIELKPGMFYYIKGIESIILPETVTTIYANTFRYCNNLKYIVIPSSVTRIENNYEFGGTLLSHIFYTGDAQQLDSLFPYVGPVKVPNATLKNTSFVTNCSTAIADSHGYYVSDPSILEKPCHAFVGWYENADFSGKAVSFPYYGEATTLYARWEVTSVIYSITDKNNIVYSAELPLDYPVGSKVVVILYDQNGIAEIKIVDFSATSHSITTEKSLVGNKLLLLQSLVSMKPLCTPFVATAR